MPRTFDENTPAAELLDAVDSNIAGCIDPNCFVCAEITSAMKELARRLGCSDFKGKIERLRESQAASGRIAWK